MRKGGRKERGEREEGRRKADRQVDSQDAHLVCGFSQSLGRAQ